MTFTKTKTTFDDSDDYHVDANCGDNDDYRDCDDHDKYDTTMTTTMTRSSRIFGEHTMMRYTMTTDSKMWDTTSTSPSVSQPYMGTEYFLRDEFMEAESKIYDAYHYNTFQATKQENEARVNVIVGLPNHGKRQQ